MRCATARTVQHWGVRHMTSYRDWTPSPPAADGTDRVRKDGIAAIAMILLSGALIALIIAVQIL